MNTIIKLDGKKISKKKAIELLGKARVEKMIKESKEIFMSDPYVLNEWFIGKGIITIEFK